jgi:hypothetical protein
MTSPPLCSPFLRSRLVTRIRNINERAFGRLTRCWGFLHRKLPSSLLHIFNDCYRLLLAVDNAFFPPLWQPKETDASDLRLLQSRANMACNPVQQIIPFLEHKWRKCDVGDMVKALPGDLNLNTLRQWNAGPYAIRLAPYYLQHTDINELKFSRAIFNSTPYFKITKFKSRFSKTKKRTVVFTFEDTIFSTYVYCTCACGTRTIGSCAHGVTALYYLMKLRDQRLQEQQEQEQQKKRFLENSPFEKHVIDISEWAATRRAKKKGSIAPNSQAHTVAIEAEIVDEDDEVNAPIEPDLMDDGASDDEDDVDEEEANWEEEDAFSVRRSLRVVKKKIIFDY